jgi:hypothetical protein
MQSINAIHANYYEFSNIVDIGHQILVTNNNRKVNYIRRQINRVIHKLVHSILQNEFVILIC